MSPTIEQLTSKNIHLFLEYYGITNDQGERLDFVDHPYLWDIFNDWSPRICIKKSAQVGLSTTIVIKALWAAKNLGLDIIYSFPTYDLSNKMVSSKVNRLIANNHIFQHWTQDKDSVEQKRIGKNTIYFQGSTNEQAAIALPADLYIADEVDRSDQRIVDLFSSRLQHSKFGWEWRFSNPSVPENGVDKWWQQSDQKEWFVRCQGCNKDQILTMEHIHGDIFACDKCGKELDRRRGQWLRRWGDSELISGYHVSSLMASHLSAQKILEERKNKPEQQFANMMLGEPYVGRGNVLPRSVLLSNLRTVANPQDEVPVIGVDTGKNIHIVVGNKYGIYYYEECPDYSKLESILQKNPRAICVMDQGGDIQLPRQLREKYRGRVYLCAFTQTQGDSIIRWKEDELMVNADRNKLIQLVVDEFTNHDIPLFGEKEDWKMFADHWSALYRVVEEDERGRRRYVWTRNGADHLALASCYWRIGMDKLMLEKAEIIMPHQNVWTNAPSMTLDGKMVKYATLKRL